MSLPLLVSLLSIAGCASVPGPAVVSSSSDALTIALQAGQCREAATLIAGVVGDDGGRRLQTAQICLQSGDFVRARAMASAFLSDFPGHPQQDYAAYLHALAGVGEWSRASTATPEARIHEGRALFGEILTFMRNWPMSAYVDDLAPRLVRLADGIAAAEQNLAERQSTLGNREEARLRARYVIEYYPRSPAAADAAHLLMAIGGD